LVVDPKGIETKGERPIIKDFAKVQRDEFMNRYDVREDK
jgi:hypothetical protein